MQENQWPIRSALLRTRTTGRIAACLLASLLVACAGVSTVAPQASITQEPAPRIPFMQAQPQHADPAPFDPAAAWAAAVALALSSATPQNELAELSPSDAPEPPEAPADEASSAEAKPAVVPAQARVTANLPVRPASASAKPLGSLAAVAPPRTDPAPPVIAKAAEPSLDVPALKLRLRDTGGMGMFDKLALKRELDHLMQQFRSHHESGQASGIALLRAPFNALVQKVLGALRERDPDLARVILASREAIWGILSDPVKFFAVN